MGEAVSEQEIRAALSRVLDSAAFSRSGRARELLAYLVGEQLAGRGDQIKGFSIALDVFGRDAGFDAARDPLVRVQMGRLRELLAGYYAKDGRDERLRIEIDKGGYCPVFRNFGLEPSETSLEETPAAQADSNRPMESAAGTRFEGMFDALHDSSVEHALKGSLASGEAGAASVKAMVATQTPRIPPPAIFSAIVLRHIRLFWAALTLIAAMLGYLIVSDKPIFVAGDPPAPPVQASKARGVRGGVTPEYLPAVDVTVKGDDARAVDVANRLASGFARFETLRSYETDITGSTNDTPTIGATFDFGVRVHAPLEIGGELHVDLVYMADRSLLATWSLRADQLTEPQFLEKFVRQILYEAASQTGVIVNHAQASEPANPMLSCITAVENFYAERSAAAHATAFICSKQLYEQKPRMGLVYSMHAAMYGEGVDRGFQLPERISDRAAGFEQARRIADEGLYRVGKCASCLRELGHIHAMAGDYPRAKAAMDRALSDNSADFSLMASVAFIDILTGNYEPGLSQMAAAVEEIPQHPTWWDYYRCVGLFMTGKSDEAYEVARDLARDKVNPTYVALRMLTAADAGKAEQAAALKRQLLERDPGFLTFAADRIAPSRHSPEIRARLLARLAEIK